MLKNVPRMCCYNFFFDTNIDHQHTYENKNKNKLIGKLN